MNVAELSLCKELHELSGWGDTDYFYENHDEYEADVALNRVAYTAEFRRIAKGFPAYDLGYLMRKLAYYHFELHYHTVDGWSAEVWVESSTRVIKEVADTPEDAACKLAIELFKQGILSKQPNATDGMEGEKRE